MKIIRVAVALITIVVTGIFIFYEDKYVKNADDTIPQISFITDTLSVPVTAGNEDLLGGVVAYDAKDGDITSRLIVERISNFSEPGKCEVTYSVVDSDNHVMKASRSLIYEDYKAPVFSFADDMIFEVGSSLSVLDNLRASDLIDGDISSRVKLISSDLITSAAGVYRLQAQVTNSKGDVSYLEFNVTMVESRKYLADIELTDYLIYLEKGAAFDPMDYYSGASYDGQPIEDAIPVAHSTVNTSAPGSYTVRYEIESASGVSGMTELLVIVEGEK